MKKHTQIFSISLAALAAVALLFACSTGTGGDEGKITNPYVVDGRIVDGVAFNMHSVPIGKTFIMGEHVQSTTQTVTLTKSFYMGETEVTQGLWEAVWGSWPGAADGEVPSSTYGLGPNKPAYYVSWYDAVAFCNLLTEADSTIADSERVYYSDETFDTPYTSGTTVYADLSKKGYRLPTEAEWEYAARYIDGTNWNGGDHVSGDITYSCYDPGTGTVSGSPLASDARIGEYAWWEGNSGTVGMPEYGCKDVGQKRSNALGLRDMNGNVWEWCYDWWEDVYSGDTVLDPTGPDDGTKRSPRGGYWDGANSSLCCSCRCCFIPTYSNYSLGFRLCRTAE